MTTLAKYYGDFFCLVIILLLGLIALWSLLTNPFYTSHDGFIHTARIANYYHTLLGGQIPPRWAVNFNGGYGSPIFVYSYPLPYMIGAGLHSFHIEYQDVFRLIIGGSYLLSGLAAYLWLRNRFSYAPALLGAIFYIWAPYRFLNVYVRGALAENLAYTFIPLVFLAIDKLFQKSRSTFWWYGLAFFLAAIFLSHNVVAAMTLPIFCGWGLWQTFLTKKIRPFLELLAATLVGFGLSAFIYLPDFFERQYVHFDQGITYWREHFVTWRQLLRSPWGYGFDLPGTANDGMSFQIGLANVLLLAIFILILVWRLVVLRRKGDKTIVNALYFGVVFVVVIFLALENPLNYLLWPRVPILTTIVDFPWRFLGIVPLVLAFIAASTINLAPMRRVVFIVLLAAVLIANRNHLRINEAQTFPDNVFDNHKGNATASSNEYTPIWREGANFLYGPKPIDVLSDKLTIRILSKTASELRFDAVATDQPGKLRINRFYFPQTRILRDNKELTLGEDFNIVRAQTTKDENDTGTLILNVAPPGGSYVLKFEETPLRKFANWLSLGTLVFMLIFMVRNLIRARVK